ncbi:acyl-CoA thioesterase [Sphingobium cupriresistens]|nr:thioesterase family protein [Sphingobium cupriresistens]
MLEMVVGADWLDELDHVSFLQHQRMADRATEILWRNAGGPPFTAASPTALVMIDVRARYARELRLDETVAVHTRVTKVDHRRLWLTHSLVCEGAVATTVDILALCFDAGKRRAALWPEAMMEKFQHWSVGSATVEP